MQLGEIISELTEHLPIPKKLCFIIYKDRYITGYLIPIFFLSQAIIYINQEDFRKLAWEVAIYHINLP